ncbi:hypothetical protein ABI59_06310 [Acidobacteria bacterium Mor1]|nr:hypothetical protein ABI59_06310 [Acidobacteria bacterium Mor1]
MPTSPLTEPFTPASASAALRELTPAVRVLRQLYRTLERRQGAGGPDRAVDPVYFELLTRFCQVRERVERGGIRLADPGRGTLEFPALRAGRPVLLQGLLGEKQVRSWRDEDRTRPLDEGPWG